MILINPSYEFLRPLLSEPEQLMAKGTAIHRGRNELCVVDADRVQLCIKRYGVPKGLQRWIYRYLRAPKGLRAFRNSQQLREAGFDSPEPIAYIQNDTRMRIGKTYYICRYQEGQTIYRWGDSGLMEIRREVEALALFAAQLHNAGLMLCDFTPGNILCTKKGFSLVDTNRMRPGVCSIRYGLRNMAGLWLQPEVADFLAHTYSAARGVADTAPYIRLFRRYRRAFWQRFTKRHHLSEVIIHRDLDGSQYSYHFNSTIQ